MADPFGSIARSLRRVVAVALGVLALAVVRADEPAKQTGPAQPPDQAKAPTKAIDPAKLPPNAVIIISDNPRDALQHPDAVVLSPEEYKKLLDAVDQSRKLATPEKPEPPSVCRLSGKVESRGSQDVAILRAEFQFRTTTPRATVLLGLQKAKPTGATIDDGKLAILLPLKEEEGYAVQVDSPGEHKLIVDFEAPLNGRGTKGGEHGLDLGLPGAAITTIERLELPADATRVRVAGRSFQRGQLIPANGGPPAVVLGPASKLELTWDSSKPTARTEESLSVEGRYDIRFEERLMTTRARLTLKVLSGTIGNFSIQAPASAEIALDNAATASGTRVERPRDARAPIWTIHREPSADDLVLDIYLRTDLEPGKTIGVPVFRVRQAPQQRGTLIVAASSQLRLTFKPSRDLSRREAPDETNRDVVFAYYRLPESGTPLEVDVQPAHGDVETHLTHEFTLTERGWRWHGKIDVRPVRTEVTTLDLDVPVEMQDLRPSSAELVESLAPPRELAPGRKLVRVQLAEARRRPFSIVFEGFYPHGSVAGSALLPLPRPLGTLDRGGQINATAPSGLELRGSLREWEQGRPGDWERLLEPPASGAAGLAANFDHSPARVDLIWRSARGDVPVTSTVDIKLSERQADVRQQWHIPTALAPPRAITLRGPTTLAGRVRGVDGSTVTSSTPGEWTTQLPPPTGREITLTVSYSFPLSFGPDRPPVEAPLLWLDPAPRCETTIRIWSGATPSGALVPALAEGPWTEQQPRAVPDQSSLPSLVLQGTGTGLPLSLRLSETGSGPGTSLVVERTWIQALVDEDGQQAYRMRCIVRPQHTHFLEVDLPAPPATILFTARIDGKQATWQAVENRMVRLRLDATADRAAQVLELAYLLVPGRSDLTRGSRWQVALAPPRLRGSVFIGPMRWQIGVASGDLAFFWGEDADFEQRWNWHRGLLAPRPVGSAATLQQWFFAGASAIVPEADPIDGLETVLTGWQPTAEPLHFQLVPRSLALLGGSLAVVGLGLAAVRWLRPHMRVALAAILAALLFWLAATHPQALSVLLYSIEPGVVVLMVALCVRWWLQRRYRRHVLFLPEFTRQRSEAIRFRNGPSERLRREPSTIDAPVSNG